MNTLYIISLCFGIQIFNLDKHAVIIMTMRETILFWSSYCYLLKCLNNSFLAYSVRLPLDPSGAGGRGRGVDISEMTQNAPGYPADNRH